MKAVIFLNGFKHNQTPLAKLFYYTNKVVEERLKELDYVYFSQQYNCYYIRWRNQDFEKLKKDFNSIANISTKYLNADKLKGKGSKHDSEVSIKNNTNEKGRIPVVSIVLVNDRTYLKLPVPSKKVWTTYLRELGSVFESKRVFWIVPDYSKKKELIRSYFQEQGCEISITVKHDEKVMAHLKKCNYKEDTEIQAFVKVMTLQGAGKRTIENYSSQIKKIKNYYDGKEMSEITDEEIVDYMFFLRHELSYSASAQNIVVSAVKRFLLSLTEREFNAMRIPRPVKKKSLPKVLEKDEITALLKLDMYIKHKCMLYMLYSTGIRCGELINLKVEDVNLDNNIVIIKMGKGDKSRIVSLSEKVKQIIIIYLQKERPNIYLFEGQKGGRYSASSVQKVVKKAVLKAGIDKRVTPHMMRHSFATHLHDMGMDIRNIQMLLGHSSTKTTEIYTYISKKDISKLKSPLDDLDV